MKRYALIVIGLLMAGSASAVTLSTDGSGQVLIYPYYTVNAGQTSTLTLANTTDQAKAVKLMIRGGASGHAVFVLNVYLGVHDVWEGTLFQLGPALGLLSNDSTCTVPDLHAGALPTVPDGRHYLPPNTGPLPPGSAPQEGYVVAIEMGTLSGASAEALKPDYHTLEHGPTDCAQLASAWQSDGYWREDSAADISAPSGGLAGGMAIMNVGHGTVFRLGPTGLKNFRVAAMHTAPEDTLPDLGSALSDKDTGIASADIRIGDAMIHSDYPADRAVDAVTAVLMSETLQTQFDFRRTIGARTAYVLTMPTKRFYVDDPTHAIAPFGREESHVTSPTGTLCPVTSYHSHDRTGVGYLISYADGVWTTDPTGFGPSPCYATSVFALDPKRRPRALLDSNLTSATPLQDESAQAGRVTFAMNYLTPACYVATGHCKATPGYAQAHINIMRPDLAGRQYFGLPVIGFAATGYINAYAGKHNVFRNYTFVTPFAHKRLCVQDSAVGSCH